MYPGQAWLLRWTVRRRDKDVDFVLDRPKIQTPNSHLRLAWHAPEYRIEHNLLAINSARKEDSLFWCYRKFLQASLESQSMCPSGHLVEISMFVSVCSRLERIFCNLVHLKPSQALVSDSFLFHACLALIPYPFYLPLRWASPGLAACKVSVPLAIILCPGTRHMPHTKSTCSRQTQARCQ